MKGEWASVRLGDVCTKIGSGATPRGGGSVYFDSGEVALIRSQNVYNEGFRRSGLAFLTTQHAQELEHVEVRPGDVLLNITGDSVARCCRVDESILPARVNQHVAIVRTDPEKLDSQFLRYCLISPQMQNQMLSWAASGGTRNALTKGMIESFSICAPIDIGEQRAIAQTLGALDNKIELNRRMNETLEAMARAIFKSWFVDFDPVRAKAEGRQPFGMDAETAALFPDSFEDSPLSKIPKGWSLRELDAIAHFLNGLALQRYPAQDGESLPVIKIAQLRKESTEGADRAATDLPPEYVVSDGDVLFSWSGSLEVVIWCGGRGALNQHLFKVTSREYPKWFYYFWIHEHLPEFQAIGVRIEVPKRRSQKRSISARN